MTVLVVGKTGQLTRALVEAGPGAGHSVIAVGRPELDLALPDTIGVAVNRLKPSVVINAAAYTAVDRAENEVDLARSINAIGAGRLARECDKHQIPIIHVSTDCVFDGWKSGAYVETDPVAPLSAYGRTKLEGERLVAAAACRHLIVRTSWVFSRYGNNFLQTMLRLARQYGSARVVSDQSGCPTYAPHLAQALLGLADTLISVGASRDVWGTYHLAGRGETTRYDMARAIFRYAAQHGGPRAVVRPITSAEFSAPARRPLNATLDCSNAERTFGIRLPHWEPAMETCIAGMFGAG